MEQERKQATCMRSLEHKEAVYTQFLKRGISQLKVIGTIMMRVTGTN
jgi:hypothetical protein